MAIEIFNRHEIKFLVPKDTFVKLQYRLKEYMEPDKFNKNYKSYNISNIYYDSEDNHLIRTSLSKPIYKEKLRVRSYGVPHREDMVFVEIKKKFNGVVNKRRTKLVLSEAYKFLETGIQPNAKPYMNPQVMNEIAYIIDRYELVPKLYLSYDRIALFGINQKDLRITFDKNIITRREDLNLEHGNFGHTLLEDDICLMEVKAEKTIPLWLSSLLSEYKLYKTSFSKYGKEYERTLSHELKGEPELCLKNYLTPQLTTLQSQWAM